MSDLIYWIAMVLIVGASIALLTGTFLSIRKNKREKNKKTGRVAAYADDYEEDEEDERELPRRPGDQHRKSGVRRASRNGRTRRSSGKLFWRIWILGKNTALFSTIQLRLDVGVMFVHMKNIFPFLKIRGYLSCTVRL